MNKILIAILAVAILIPTSVYAFSYPDIFSFGKKIFVNEGTKIYQNNSSNEDQTMPLSLAMREMASQKYDNWKNAFDKKDLMSLFDKNYNFYFTDGEISYIVNQSLSTMSNPPVTDVDVTLNNLGIINVAGNSKIKLLPGAFDVKAKFEEVNGKMSPKVVSAKYHGFPIPAFIANNILSMYLKDVLSFFYSNSDYTKLNIDVGDNYLKLDYAK